VLVQHESHLDEPHDYSTGLTASLGIGRHVVHLLQQEVLPRVEPLDPHHIRTTPLPSLDVLVREFRRRGDGKVTIHGHEYKVTHPLTVMGWSEGAQFDAIAPRT
jgi:glycerol-3-phosphate dehydrogenase